MRLPSLSGDHGHQFLGGRVTTARTALPHQIALRIDLRIASVALHRIAATTPDVAKRVTPVTTVETAEIVPKVAPVMTVRTAIVRINPFDPLHRGDLRFADKASSPEVTTRDRTVPITRTPPDPSVGDSAETFADVLDLGETRGTLAARFVHGTAEVTTGIDPARLLG
jgi:hypothetical protein